MSLVLCSNLIFIKLGAEVEKDSSFVNSRRR